MAGEKAAAKRWLEATAKGATGLDAFNGQHDGKFPVVVYSLNRSFENSFSGRGRVWFTGSYLIKAITKGGGTAKAEELAERIDAAFLLKTGEAAGDGHLIDWCRATGESVDYPETDQSGNVYRHMGAIYSIACRER